MKTKVLIVLLMMASLIACKKWTQKMNADAYKEIEEVSLLDTLRLKLNNGDKWIANRETHVGIKNMDSIIKVFKGETTKDYVALGKALSKQTGFVIKNCSMKGEPHDQLHVVLVPMLDEISILKESETKENLEKTVYKLERIIENYFSHFKL